VLVLQPLQAQLPTGDGTGAAGWLAAREQPFAERFDRLLLDSQQHDYARGFDLAQRLGLPAVPLLRQMLHDNAANGAHRTIALAAALPAGGAALDGWLFEWLGQQKVIREERTMAALVLALGAPREHPIADFWARALGPDTRPEEILAIAARLAAARIPGTSADGPHLGKDEIGLAAATAYAGLPVPAAIANARWNLQAREPHGDLFWRGALLAGCRQLAASEPVDGGLLVAARKVAALGDDGLVAARGVALRYLAMAGQLSDDGTRPDHRLLREAVVDRAAARRLGRWLEPQPSPLDDDPGRLAVGYVLSRTPVAVVADRANWAARANVRREIALALAIEVLDRQDQGIEEVTLPELPECQFVRWAAGQRVTAVRCADPGLSVMLELAAAGRLPREAGRAGLEEALWRLGCHPEAGRFAAELELVRDLLLVGNNPGYLPHVRTEDRYRPKGIDTAAFFAVAVAYYDFVRTRRPPLPRSYRLR